MLLILAATVLALIYVFIRRKLWHMEKLSENIPGEKTLPLIGNIRMVMGIKSLSQLWFTMMSISSKYERKKIMKFWFGPILGIGIWDPAYVEEVMNCPYTVNKGSIYYLVFGEIFDGVFVADGGSKWRELRKPITRASTKQLVERDYLEVFVRRSKEFCGFIKAKREGNQYNVLHDSARLFLDTFCETHLGVHVNELTENKWNFVDNIEEFIDITFKSILKYHLYFWKIAIKFTKLSATINNCKEEVDNFLQWVLDERKDADKRSERKDYYPDFLLRRASEKKLPLQDTRKELADLVLGGSDTSSVLTSTALMFLAMFPEVQEEAYREQVAIFGDSSRDLTIEDLSSMGYLERVVKETLRHVSPPGIFRTCTKDLNLGEYTIPRGTYLYLFLHRMKHDPDYWERPNTFYPDHFLPEQEAGRPKHVFLPFGCGPRMCPGFRYGMCSIMTVLSTVIRRFKISTTEKFEDLTFEYKLLLQVKDGYMVKFEERKSDSTIQDTL